MKYVPPLLFLLFGAALLGVWALERKLRFALILAAAFCVLSMAMFSHFAGLPPDSGHNALLSGFLYTAAMLLVAEGILQRSQQDFPLFLAILYLIGIVAGLWYFFYVDRNLVARVYILNLGMGLILLHACWYARSLLVGTWTDKALLCLLAISGLHFLPRTFLTVHSLTAVTTAQDFGQTDFWQTLVLTTSVLGAAGGLCLLGILVVDIIFKLQQERDIDPLTGVLNRRGLDRHVRKREAEQPGFTRMIAICDLDRFKEVNDTYGHGTGDAVLTLFADIIRQNVRKNDIVARLGGEEFALVLNDVTEEQALALIERIREALGQARFSGAIRIPHVTCSMGLARIRSGEPFWASLKRADRALYEAKRAGRNRIRAEWHGRDVDAVASNTS